jgi:hypothetical protein
VVAHTCDSGTPVAEQENHKFKVSLGYIVSLRPLWDI